MKADGTIRNMERYLQGKALDHSKWMDKLPRGITPSDIDMVWDFGGRLLFGELKYSADPVRWSDLPTGQQRLWRNILRLNPTRTVLALISHGTDPERVICTVESVQWFSFVRHTGNGIELSGVYHNSHPGRAWMTCVQHYSRNADDFLQSVMWHPEG